MPSKTKPKTAKANPDRRGNGDELHQSAGGEHAVLTTNQGLALSDNQNSLRATERGPTLLEDFILREKITHFDHERIPERIVHARGSAAHGYFELTKSLKKYSRARILTEVGERTPLFCRFSTVAGGAGSVDTPRDVRGFAVKFYTKEGNWDLVGNNIPVFFIQDAMKFPDLIHAVKMEADRGFPQAASAHDTFWDFISLMPEVDAHDHVGDERSRDPPLVADDRRLRRPQLPAGQRERREHVRQVPLAAEARTAVDGMGRSGQAAIGRQRLSPPRPVRGDPGRQLPGMGTRGAALHAGAGRPASLRPSRCDQAHSRRNDSAHGRRPHGAGSLARQLLRRDRAGRLLPVACRARHRLQQRSAAAGTPVLLPRHAAVAPGRPELPPDPDQRAEVPVRQPAARRAHADGRAEGTGELRTQFFAGRLATGNTGRVPEPRHRGRRRREGSHPCREFCRPLHPGAHVLPQPDRAGAGAHRIGPGVRTVQGRNPACPRGHRRPSAPCRCGSREARRQRPRHGRNAAGAGGQGQAGATWRLRRHCRSSAR